MSNPFRKSITVRRPPAGAFVNGRWTQGSATAMTITASVQPTTGDDLESLPEGRRTLGTYRLYTDTQLLEGRENERKADIVELFGDDYEVMRVMPWQNGIISHYKVLVARLQPS